MMALSGCTGRYPGNRDVQSYSTVARHAYGMFMERFNELSELRKCAECFRNGRVSSREMCTTRSERNETNAEYLVRKFDANGEGWRLAGVLSGIHGGKKKSENGSDISGRGP